MTDTTPKVFAIWSRPPKPADTSGGIQQRVARQKALRLNANLREAVHPSVFKHWGKARGGLAFLGSWLAALLSLRPLPLQAALYAYPRDALGAFAAAPDETVLFDSQRQITLVERLRKRHPSQRIIVDMDDLMSRRNELLLALDAPASLGAFQEETPRWFGRLLAHRGLMRLILRYEAASLRRVEARICALADDVVLISAHETAILRARHPRARARIHHIPPAISLPETVIPFQDESQSGPLRCVFIGSDTLIQNRSSIDWLLAYWARHKPPCDLVIFGRQSRSYTDLPLGVRLHGFVESLSEVYDGRSVLFCPTQLAGGVKTKALEAFAHGAPVIGTALTWEGMAPHPAFVTEDRPEVAALLAGDTAARAHFVAEAARAQTEISALYGPVAFRAAWQACLNAAMPPAPPPQPSVHSHDRADHQPLALG